MISDTNLVIEVRGNSMTGILEHGDRVAVIAGPICKYDLVIYMDIKGGVNVKQVIGIPNDRLHVQGNSITIEDRTISLTESEAECWKTWIPEDGRIPGGCLFLIGTRADSIDSKQTGFIFYPQILGRAKKLSILE